jgi:hypothetical protein
MIAPSMMSRKKAVRTREGAMAKRPATSSRDHQVHGEAAGSKAGEETSAEGVCAISAV